MSRITNQDLERQLRRLNDAYGFKGYGRTVLKSGKLKAIGKGFSFYVAYGGVQLVFKKAPSTGQRSISSRMSKKEMFYYIETMIDAVDMYQRRSKM
jgi:hypothetical protein